MPFVPILNRITTVLGVSVNHQRSANGGHRLVAGTETGSVFTVGQVARVTTGGIEYAAIEVEHNIRSDYLPVTAFVPDAAISTGGGSFPPGPVTVTCSDLTLEGYNTSFTISEGDGSIHCWAVSNLGGGFGSDTVIDVGGGPTSIQIAQEIETRINAIAGLNVVVGRVDAVLDITSTIGVACHSGDAGIVVS